MPTTEKIRRVALLSLMSSALIFISLPLPYIGTTRVTSAPGSDVLFSSTSYQDTWNRLFGALLQPDVDLTGKVIAIMLVLFLLGLPTFSVFCLIRPANPYLSRAGVALSGTCLVLCFIICCANASAFHIFSSGSTEATTTLGPGFYLFIVGVLLTPVSMVALYRLMLAQLRGQGSNAP
jgi:hypothetical protein